MSDSPPPPPPPWPSTRLPLANLTPEVATAQPAFIEGVTTLIWPFSQSSQSFSILVCEEDFRLRMNKGQLRLNFKGPSAKEVASRVTIGNKVTLLLDGVSFEELEDVTPRDVPWSLNVRGGLRMKVRTDTGEEDLEINPPPSEVAPENEKEQEEEGEDADGDDDRSAENEPSLTTPPRPSVESSWNSQPWKTPGIFKRPVSMMSDSPLFPTGFFGDEDEDDYAAETVPRKRMRFNQSFRLYSRSPSPTPNAPPMGKAIAEESGDETVHAAPQHQDPGPKTSVPDSPEKHSVDKDSDVDMENERMENDSQSPKVTTEASNADVDMRDEINKDVGSQGDQGPSKHEPGEAQQSAGTREYSKPPDIAADLTQDATSEQVSGIVRESSPKVGSTPAEPPHTPLRLGGGISRPSQDTSPSLKQPNKHFSSSLKDTYQDPESQENMNVATPPATQLATQELKENGHPDESKVRGQATPDSRPHPGSPPQDTQPSAQDRQAGEDSASSARLPNQQLSPPATQEGITKNVTTVSVTPVRSEVQIKPQGEEASDTQSTPNKGREADDTAGTSIQIQSDVKLSEPSLEIGGTITPSEAPGLPESQISLPSTPSNPPVKPRIHSTGDVTEQAESAHLCPLSPTLHAVPSPQLPQISPFLARFTGVDYLPPGKRVVSVTSAPESERRTSPDSSSESERDSLFDEPAESDFPLPPKSISTPTKLVPPPLDLSTPVRRQSTSCGTHKTPQLYLPTPSPKVTKTQHDGSQFPFPNDNRDVPVPADLQNFFKRLAGEELPSVGAPTPASSEPALAIPSPAIISSLSSSVTSSFQPSPITGFKSGITTSLSDFPPLAFLSWGNTIDVIGVVTQHIQASDPEKSDTFPRATADPNDYYITVRIVDSSKLTGTVFRIFRPHPESLPRVETGDVVLLRAFRVGSNKNRLVGISKEDSAWAVWRTSAAAEAGEDATWDVGEAICNGPPVEYGDEEKRYVRDIAEWWKALDEKVKKDMMEKGKEDLDALLK